MSDGISDISSSTKLEIVANRKEPDGISIPPYNALQWCKREERQVQLNCQIFEGGGCKDGGACKIELIR